MFPRKSSIIIAADESTISWGPSPTFGELVRPEASATAGHTVHYNLFTDNTGRGADFILKCFLQGYGDNKPKSSTTAQEVKTLDGVYIEQVTGLVSYY